MASRTSHRHRVSTAAAGIEDAADFPPAQSAAHEAVGGGELRHFINPVGHKTMGCIATVRATICPGIIEVLDIVAAVVGAVVGADVAAGNPERLAVGVVPVVRETSGEPLADGGLPGIVTRVLGVVDVVPAKHQLGIGAEPDA